MVFSTYNPIQKFFVNPYLVYLLKCCYCAQQKTVKCHQQRVDNTSQIRKESGPRVFVVLQLQRVAVQMSDHLAELSEIYCLSNF